MQATNVIARTARPSSRTSPGPHETVLLKLSLPPEPQYVAFARKTVRDVVQQLSISGDGTADVLLALGEACNNAVLYGASRPTDPLSVTCRLMRHVAAGGDALEIDVRNHGTCIPKRAVSDRRNMPPAEELNEHGRGLPLMYQLMDSVEFICEDGDTIVRLTKNLR